MYPSYDWDTSSAGTSNDSSSDNNNIGNMSSASKLVTQAKKSQLLLASMVERILPAHTSVLTDYVHPLLRYEVADGKRPMQLDVWVPSYKLAFGMHV